MPELPEVKAFASYIKHTSLHKKITDVTAQSKRLIKECSFDDFKKNIKNKKFTAAQQRGKYVIIKLSHRAGFVVMHFGMTGSVHYVKADTQKKGDDKYTKVSFYFANGYVLRWINKRKFGAIYFTKKKDDLKQLAQLGPDALSLTKKAFLKLLNDHPSQNIKSFLMSQKTIAGIGNEYSDEILFQARIYPKQKVDDLTKKEKETLYTMMKKVLKEAIAIRVHNKTFNKNKWLIAHRHKNAHCPLNNNHKLKNETIAGRSAYWCPKHQKRSS